MGQVNSEAANPAVVWQRLWRTDAGEGGKGDDQYLTGHRPIHSMLATDAS